MRRKYLDNICNSIHPETKRPRGDLPAANSVKMRRTTANLELIERLGDRAPTEVVALPIMHGNRTIGILYGDNAEHRAPIDDLTGLEIFLSQAGAAFESAAAEREN